MHGIFIRVRDGVVAATAADIGKIECSELLISALAYG